MNCPYPPNTLIVVTTTNGVYTGTFLGIRNHDFQGQGGQFLYIQLSVASGSYTAGETIALNLIQVVAIGPVAAPCTIQTE